MFYNLSIEDLKKNVSGKILKDLEGEPIEKVEVVVRIYEKKKIGIRVPFNDKEFRNGFSLFLYDNKKAPDFMKKLEYKKGIYFYNHQLLKKQNMEFLDTVTDLIGSFQLKKMDKDNLDFDCLKEDEKKWKFIFSKIGIIGDDKEKVNIYDKHFWFIEGLL